MRARARESYRVYVVELDRELGRKAVYVGSTAHAISSRMLRHLQGRKASRYVREYGVRLRPDLAGASGPFSTREQARDAEGRLAGRLRRRGYRVYGGT